MFYPIEALFRITDFYYLVFDRRFSENFNFDGEKHDFWEAVYVVDGKVEVTENEKVYVMGERDIIFHSPNDFHCIRSAEGTRPKVLNVSFRIEGDLPEFLKSGVLHLSADLHKEYTEIVCMLKERMDEAVNRFEASLRLSTLFMRLIRESQVQNSLSTSPAAQTFSSVVELMHNEIYNNLSLEDFAKKSYISVSYIKKLFNHYAGIGPKSYYSNLRLAEAQKLILAGETVTAIAEKLNFSSVGYFTIFFKNQSGYTPSLYRKIQH